MADHRDSQVGRVYAAESDARKAFGPGAMFPSAHAFRTAHDKATRSEWWIDNIGIRPTVILSPRMRTTARANYARKEVRIGTGPRASWSWSALVLTHELSHLVTDSAIGQDLAPHGPEFVGVHLDIITALIGGGARNMMERHYAVKGVRIRPWGIDLPASPLLGALSLASTARPVVDTEFAARRAERLATARENRKGMAATSAALSR